MISMPLSSGSFSSSSVSPARPPPNSVLKVCWKLRLIAANASVKRCRVVSSMRLIASLVCAIESTRSLRCVVRNAWRVSSSSNCSIAIMLTGPSRSIFARSVAIASSALSARCSRGDDGGVGCESRRSAGRLVCQLRRLLGADRRRASGVAWPSRSSCSTSSDDLVERRLDRVLAGVREVRQVGFGGRARDVELGDDGANRVERAARVLDRGFVLVGPGAQRRHRVVGGMHVADAARRARGRRRRAALRRRRSRRAAIVDAAPRLVELGGERRGALLELGGRFLEPLRLRTPARRARSTSAACAAPASAARRLRSSVASRASNRRRCATVSRSSACRCSLSEPRDRRPRLLLPPVERVALLLGLTPLARELLALLRQPRLLRRSARCSCASWPTTAFSCLWCSAFSAAIAFDAWAIVASSSAVSCAEPRRARRARRRCGRAAP